MAKNSEIDLTRIGWLDYVLMSLGSCLAVFSAGMSIQEPAISYFCIILVVIGTLVSYGVRILTIKSLWIKFDALFYSAAIIGAIFFSAELRDVMPDGGFPREIAAAGWLSWMIILGSFATWQDSTLLFQAIPALALFGLVGCYDTYSSVTFSFFGFLLCLATLFARAHGREMLQKAADSGYFTRGLAPGTPIPSVETTPGLALKLKKGPWRWVAGPEWALASALGVVLVSLLGAPVIRQSVSGVAGFVRLNTPPIRSRQTPTTSSSIDQPGQNVRVGRPYNHSIARRMLEATLDQIRYLRAETYDHYTGHGWQNSLASTSDDGRKRLLWQQLKDRNEFQFKIQTLRGISLLPLPPEVITLNPVGNSQFAQHDDGTFQTVSSVSDGDLMTGTSAEPLRSFRPTESYKGPEMAPYLVTESIPARVQQLAKTVTAKSKSDYEMANAISAEISKRILYNLDAAETPAENDPVEYTLFEEKEGYCTAFASAMVLMARSVGLPARYIQGYLPDERRHERNGPYVVTDADYHAWAEIFFKDAGWVVFDPTLAANAKEGEGLGESGDTRPWFQKGLISAVFDVLIVATLVIGGIVATVQIRNYRRLTNHRTELEKLYMAFSKRLERVAKRRRNVGQTADEFLETVRPLLGSAYVTAQALNERFVVAMYSAETVGLDQVESIRQDLKQFQAALKSEKQRPKDRAS